MKSSTLRLILMGLLVGIIVLQQGSSGRAQSGPDAYNGLGDTQPAWSPTGELIAFVSTRDLKPEIYVMNADGTAPHRLTTSPPGSASSTPTWSPDGRHIVFVTGMIGASQISVMNADGSGLKLMVSGQGNTAPAWSPDGRKIAFVSNRTGRTGVYVIGAEGGEPINLTPEFTEATLSHSVPSASAFSWSPDSRRLAFATTAFVIGAPHADGDCATIHFSNIDMHEECRVYVTNADLRYPRNFPSAPIAPGGGPAWSPDGSSIASVSTQRGSLQIHVMSPDGGGRVPLTSQGANFDPVWSPDGRRVAFVSDREGPRRVFVMNADGSGQLRVTRSGEGKWPSWSPDGQRIVYASKRGTLWQLYSVKVDGIGETPLTEGK